MERVVLVDEADVARGSEEKLAAHRAGLLHRAFSIFVFDGAGRLLLQRRADGKYHSAGQWSNTCCGHPRPAEPLEAAARRRLQEEMGLACALRPLGTYRYQARLDGGLSENEIDHLLVGEFEGRPSPDPREASAWRWVAPGALRREVEHDPLRFTVWLRGCLGRVLASLPAPPRPRPAAPPFRP
ncbi:MAG: isopentenyl-diphosphate Delta-isomerase [Deltaproteobacteria bacterium]|nr:isopentenyl-diphosphate Delta-isomerase [Deltaproteobacteria bacterium]